jgi:hypothetical protein
MNVQATAVYPKQRISQVALNQAMSDQPEGDREPEIVSELRALEAQIERQFELIEVLGKKTSPITRQPVNQAPGELKPCSSPVTFLGQRINADAQKMRDHLDLLNDLICRIEL